MKLHALGKSSGRNAVRKRVGRGRGSGVGKTCGRGHKGQMARKGSTHRPGFEGGQMPLIRRLPKRGFKNPTREVFLPVNVGRLSQFEDGTEVTAGLLRSSGLANGPGDGIKILGQGDLNRRLTVKIRAFSASARAKIEAAGGTCEIVAD
jgi:large subunit ribosomal protein L15